MNVSARRSSPSGRCAMLRSVWVLMQMTSCTVSSGITAQEEDRFRVNHPVTTLQQAGGIGFGSDCINRKHCRLCLGCARDGDFKHQCSVETPVLWISCNHC